MFVLIRVACLLVASATFVLSAPTPASENHLAARRLLGTSFGLPGNKTFDYVVVGGGTAGLAIATRLAEDASKQVAVIEAGSFYEIGNSNLSQIPVYGPAFSGKSPQDIAPLVDWAFLTTPQKGFDSQPVHYARGKCLGGSSARNYLSYQRPTKQSLQQWADAVGDQSYTWDSFLPYFEQSLHFTKPDTSTRPANATPEYDPTKVGTGKGPLSVTFGHYAQAFSSWARLAMQQVGINSTKGFTSGSILGSSYQLLTIDPKQMTRDSSETSFLQKNGLQRSNLIVYQSTLAKRIIFDDSKTATGVEIDIGEHGGVTFVLSATKEVIVSAGAFQSPQLLMVSGVGPAATLQKHNIPVVADRPGVGQNMWDHVLGGPSYRVRVLTTSALGNAQYAAQAALQFNSDHPSGMLTDSGADILAPNDGYNYATIATVLVAPLSRGTVDITSANMADAPLINPNWLTHPTDQAVAVAGYKRARQIFETSAMKFILLGAEYFPGPGLGVKSDAEILAFVRKSFSTVFHASCTCKMGKQGDAMAVVDANAKVMGVKGLRVVDASSFPLLPPGHPVAVVYALAEKIADDIKKGS